MSKARYLSPFGRAVSWAIGGAVLVAVELFAASHAHAQALPAPASGGNVTLSVTTSEGTPTALPASPGTFPDLVFHNDGAQEIFCAAGVGTSFTVTTTSYQIAVPTKTVGYMHNATADHVACVTASSTSTARVYENAGGGPFLDGLGG